MAKINHLERPLERLNHHFHYMEQAYYHDKYGQALPHALEAKKELEKVIEWLKSQTIT